MATFPDVILFDLDGTLCEYERPSDTVLAATFEQLGVDPLFDMQAFHGRYTEFLREAETGEELYEQCFTALATDAGYDVEFGHQLTATFLRERDVTAVVPCHGAHEVIQALDGRTLTGLVTNGHPDLQRRKLEAIEMDDVFDAEIYAGYDCPAKPAPDAFERILIELDVEPSDAVYVGNSPTHDVAGAHNAGLRSVLITNGKAVGSERPTVRCSSLIELLTIEWEERKSELSRGDTGEPGSAR